MVYFIEDQNGMSWSCSQAVSKPVWHIPLRCVQWKTPDNRQRNCLKHVEFYSKNKFEKLVHLVGFVIRTFYCRNWTGKSRDLTCHWKHRGGEEVQNHLYLNSTQDRGGHSTPLTGHFPTGRQTRQTFYKRLARPQGRCWRVYQSILTIVVRIPNRPGHSKSL